MMILRFSVQGEDFLSVRMASVMFYNLVWKRKIFLSILIARVICVHYSQLVDHCVT